MSRRSNLATDEFASILARQNGCVKCLDASPTCPACDDTEECQVTVPLNCTECPKAYCAVKSSTTSVASSSSSSSSNRPSAGAIAGGVIGGLAAIAIVTYLVWRFCIKTKRGNFAQEQWQHDPEQSKERGANDFASARSQRQSAFSVHSVASTVLTRASNIIQIAYIPGVTNRATPTSPTLLVPPVPPIPLALSDAGTPSSFEEQHFFVPGDLRDSTYSGISGYSDRTSYARSYAPRSSVASTIYGKNAVISPMPAQKGTLLKPSIVSVKSRATSGSGSETSTPPVPSVDYDKYEKPEPSPAFSIGATFFKNASASTATAVRPQVVRVGSGPKMVDAKSPSASVSSSEVEEPEPLIQVRDESRARESSADETPGPFADPPPTPSEHRSTNNLSAVIEEATRRASAHRGSDSNPSLVERGRSPFGDEHALRD
ncbi:uncharacterized protein BCR38DRAFT_482226 [Pseudomassariella vexata]|uniref:Membrane anchor Opy2 N-terminal domain-containing protein n=1 Tax=Pseudomassariella vexata TaxID=1141098 RepID=A0A1Y2EAZ2_9PEZI|nr:uncharacterized protein BCR38DRAFT_482226 [Pseudomassariella vexata]ORY68740.1 hypothetical protein BCR38DRAFT_482226 [Pseudomassariella vexata]